MVAARPLCHPVLPLAGARLELTDTNVTIRSGILNKREVTIPLIRSTYGIETMRDVADSRAFRDAVLAASAEAHH